MSSSFLSSVERCPHRERVRRCVELGRAAASGDARARKTLVSLRASEEPYDRSLGLWAFYGDRDPAALLAALGDRSATLRRRAARAVPLLGDDDALLALERVVSPRQLTGALRRLARQGRAPLAERLLERLDADRAAVVLPFVSLREERLPAELSPVRHRRLAARQPEAALRLLDRAPRALSSVGGVLARALPDEILERLRARLLAGEPLHEGDLPTLHTLARQRPEALVRLLQAHQARCPGLSLAGVAHHLSPQALSWAISALPDALPAPEPSPRWWRRLDEAQREAVRQALLSEPTVQGAFVLGTLPQDDPRREEAFQRWLRLASPLSLERLPPLPPDLRRRAAQASLERMTLGEIEATGPLLGWEDARQWMRHELTHPEMERRAEATGRLFRVARRDREALPLALAYATARPREADPVRLAMLSGLAAVPRRWVRPNDLPAVTALVAQALAAADLSSASAEALRTWLRRLFLLDPAWALSQLQAVARAWPTPLRLGGCEPPWPSEVPLLAEKLEGFVRAQVRQKEQGLLCSLAVWLGRHAARVPGLLPALLSWARARSEAIDEQELELLLELEPQAMDKILRAWLVADVTLALCEPVARWLSTRAQDLLPAVLSCPEARGRMSSGAKVRVVLPELPGLGHGSWTGAQHRAFAEALVALPPQRHQAAPLAAHLARLCWRPWALRAWASGKSSARAEAAALALGQADDDSLDDLLLGSGVEGTLARQAFARGREAGGRLLRQASGEDRAMAWRLLAPVEGERARERMLELSGPQNALLERIAALHGLAALPLDGPSRDELVQAVRGEERCALAALALPRWRGGALADEILLAALAHPSARVVRRACRWLSEGPSDGPALREALLAALEREVPWAAAPWLQRLVPGEESLVASRLAQVPRVWPLLDSPRPAARAVRRALLALVQDDPQHAPASVALAGSLDPDTLLGCLERLAERGEACVDVLMAAEIALVPHATPAIEARLAASAHAPLRSLAPGVLWRWASSPHGGWGEPERARWQGYLSDPEAAVAYRAARCA
jgi:hypothetical protein